ncbi:aminoglycoside phosphotransferase family protein [Dactylosporangium sp. NPDC005555]|uniref:phosphotransferase enzyme family protein n=1 Tax=Dactylosporangium sp. NPDC005555 TaxID=3154889 RepID=UPI00339F878A
MTTDGVLIGRLLDQAGLEADGAATPMGGPGELNRHWLVRTRGGDRVVARVFGWPFDDVEPVDRFAKEAWLLGRLADAGAPVPRPLARVRAEEGAALLLTWAPGRPLGDLSDRDDAWQAAGRALRAVHDTRVAPLWTPGVVVDGGVRPFAGGWGGHIAAQVELQAERLAPHRPELAVQLRRAVAVVRGLTPWLDRRPVTVLHADAHPWNVLVDGTTATWLDWEFAAVGDPHYDVVRMFLGRMKAIGAPPAAFLDGYGGSPPEAARRVYELHYHLWMANDARHFAHRATYDDAAAYLRDLSARLDALEAAPPTGSTAAARDSKGW